MTLLRLRVDALSRSRFALSPAAETLASLMTLYEGRPERWFRDWHRRHHAGLHARLERDQFARGLTDLLSATTWLPDYVAPPPRNGMATTIGSELEVIAAGTDPRVRRDLERALEDASPGRDLRWVTGRHLGQRTADFLHDVWTEVVAHDWPRRRAILERDVMHRAGILAAYGWFKALDEIRPGTSWASPTSSPSPTRRAAGALVGLPRPAP